MLKYYFCYIRLLLVVLSPRHIARADILPSARLLHKSLWHAAAALPAPSRHASSSSRRLPATSRRPRSLSPTLSTLLPVYLIDFCPFSFVSFCRLPFVFVGMWTTIQISIQMSIRAPMTEFKPGQPEHGRNRWRNISHTLFWKFHGADPDQIRWQTLSHLSKTSISVKILLSQ